MTPEQLLTPRYKVVADYPASPYNVGDILIFWEISQGYDESKRPITLDLQEEHGWEIQRRVDEEEFKKFPHIFKPLQWWEERKLEEMPQYIRLTRIGLVKKVEKWHTGLRCFDAMHEGRIYPYDIETPAHELEQRYMPATESEYLTYINSK